MFARPIHRRRLASLTAAVSAIALQATVAAAAPVPTLEIAPRSVPAVADGAVDAVLKRLPAGPDELTFRGETASRSFTVQLGRSEAARTSMFQLALLTAVSLLPERSIVKLSVNGTVLGTVQAGSPDKATLLPIRIPPGLLVPGANTVRISAALTHRVDCSVQATYELWAKLDPAQTGFIVPRDAAAPIRSLDDLALEPLAADGTSHIHLRMAREPDAAEVGRAAGLIDAIARRAGLVRPVVSVGPELGTGAGFDLVVSGPEDLEASAEGLSVVSRGAGIVMGRDSATNRLVVVIAGGMDPAALAASPAGATVAPIRSPIEQGFRKSLTELGLPIEIFAGRHYMSAIDVALPPDFLASNDRARLLLDGSHAGSLVDGSGLVFRVNGTLVSAMPFATGKPERFQHAIVELPLRFFHPGHNELAIEGTTLATADGRCDSVGMSREPRMTIAGSSELDFPGFAHLATLPQIPAAMAFDAGAPDGSTHLYVPAADQASLGTGLSLLANMAVTQERMNAPQVHIGMPAENDPPGIVVAEGPALPELLTAALGKIVSTAPRPVEPSATREAMASSAATTTAPSTTLPGDDVSATDAAPPDAGWLSGLNALYTDAVDSNGASVVEAAQSLLRDHGFFFAGDQKSEAIPVAADGLLIAAIAPQSNLTTIGGVTLPQLTRDASHWLVVTATSRAAAQSALERLIASGRWAALGGEAVSFDPVAGTMHTLQPRTVSYVMPDRLVLSDVRPILGGVMSDNIVLSVGVMLVLMGILGLSTHVVIRRMGVR